MEKTRENLVGHPGGFSPIPTLVVAAHHLTLWWRISGECHNARDVSHRTASGAELEFAALDGQCLDRWLSNPAIVCPIEALPTEIGQGLQRSHRTGSAGRGGQTNLKDYGFSTHTAVLSDCK
jgi:hypothetical protein